MCYTSKYHKLHNPSHPVHCTPAQILHLPLILLLIGSDLVLNESLAKAYDISVTRMGQFTGAVLEPTGKSNLPAFPTIYNADQCRTQKVYGTDLGANYSVTVNGTNYVRFLFGDTLAEDILGSQFNIRNGSVRRSAIVGYTDDDDASDGITNLEFIHSGSDMTAKQVIPISPLSSISGTYAVAGWSAAGLEWIWAVDYDLTYARTYDTKIFASYDQWNTSIQAGAYMLPRGQAAGNFRFGFDFVAVFKVIDASGVEWIYFAGLPQRRFGDVLLMRIRSSDMLNWLWAIVFPEIWVGDTSWVPINTYTGDATPALRNVGEGSAMWVTSIGKWLAINMSADFTRVEARISRGTTPNDWLPPILLLKTDSCKTDPTDMVDNVLYRGAYMPTLIAPYTADSDKTAYFLISRMNPEGGAAYNRCTSEFTCSISGPASDSADDFPCNMAYNTFLMKLTITGEP